MTLNNYFKARYYDATIGKFHSPDTVGPDPNVPLRLNHYAYADNNPLKYRDSTGHYTETSDAFVTPSVVINAPPPMLSQPTQPLVNVAPPNLMGSALIFTGQLNVGLIQSTRQQNVLPSSLITITPILNSADWISSIFNADSAKLHKVLGGTANDGLQAHHVIPAELEQNALVQRAIRAGWNFDEGENGLLLPRNRELADELQLPQHRGPHPSYNDEMRTLLNVLSDLADDHHLSDRQVASMLTQATDVIKTELATWDPSLRLP